MPQILMTGEIAEPTTDPRPVVNRIACAPEAADALLDLAYADGFDRTAVIGRVVEGPARVRVA